MTRLTTQEIEAIRNRASLATPGDWYSEISTFENATEKLTEIAVQPGVAMQVRSESDAEFIANAREDIPALLAEVEALREALQFYADSENNDYELNNAPYWTEFKASKVIDDGGWCARNALGGGK